MFDLTGKKKKPKAKKPDINKNTTKMAKDIRKRFLSNLKEQHKTIQKEIKEEQRENTKSTNENEPEQMKDFDQTTHFLNNLVERRKKRQKTKKSNTKTLKNTERPTLQIKTEHLGRASKSTSVTSVYIKPDPPFGILKKGKKKTYREYFNKPLKIKIEPPEVAEEIIERGPSPTPVLPPTPMKTTPPVSIDSLVVEEPPKISTPILSRIEKLQQFKAKLPEKKPKTYTLKRRHFSLGLKNNEVSFLKKNKTVRREYDLALSEMSIMPIISKKQFLYSKGLLKHGSEAPDDVVCQMYKDAILCGNIETIKRNDLNIRIE